jgi:murein DD-endopeptidase MepM/ murein hydrolase activator NlpD
MKDDDKNWIRKKLQAAFLTAMRACLNEEKAAKMAAAARKQFPGMPKDALAQILTKRAIRKTMIEGAATGGAITAAEAVIAAPAPEVGQRVGAIASIGTLLATDVAYTTKVQMQLLLEIGELYECPFNKDDEDDVWLIFMTALGVKGTERVGLYGRFVFTETAKKQFRSFLRTGARQLVQDAVRRIAGKEIAKYVSEKALMRLIPVANAAISAWFNRCVTSRVGKWAKVRAKIRASTFQSIDRIKITEPGGAILTLPVIFLTGTANGEVTDNIVTLYSQATARLELSETDIQEIERILDDENLEESLNAPLRCLQSSAAKTEMLNIGITAAGASRLAFNVNQHNCLVRLSETLGLSYSREQLEQKIAYFQK